jgi:ABC-2 type transport system permease protein
MNKILLVIQREYITRVSKKSFWISSILAPFLLTAIYAVPIWLAMKDKEVKKVAILDNSRLYKPADLVHKELVFTFTNMPEEAYKSKFADLGFDAFVTIPANVLANPKGVHIYSSKNIGLSLMESIEGLLQTKIRQQKMLDAGISAKVYEDTQVNVVSETITISETGDESSSSSAGAMILGGIMGFVLYMTLLLYGSQVMNSVIEEKNNRVVEVIITSVKPFQLMLGKIVGVGLVGLTQFLLWIVLTFGLIQATSAFYKSYADQPVSQAKNLNGGKVVTQDANDPVANSVMGEVTKVVESTNIPLILLCFLYYFLVGYMMYSSLFAAIGSAVENVSEAGQFTFIVMLPIILSIFLAQYAMLDPDSSITFWASMIPFTSPINMMVRLPYGVPTWELMLSMVLLFLGFMLCSWISARIYRVGILMYGKKITWKELGKWLFYSN